MSITENPTNPHQGLIEKLEDLQRGICLEHYTGPIDEAIQVLKELSPQGIKVNSAGTVAVAQSVFWLPIDDQAPLGVRLLLINRAAGRATDGQLGSKERFFDYYQAFPKFRD